MWKLEAITEGGNRTSLNVRPFVGDMFEASNKADELAKGTEGVLYLEFKSFFCIDCEHCKLDQWIPQHPLFRCDIGGELDTRTTQVISCPESI
jgi:hypothetical protein